MDNIMRCFWSGVLLTPLFKLSLLFQEANELSAVTLLISKVKYIAIDHRSYTQ